MFFYGTISSGNLDFWATISENGRRSSHLDNSIQIGKCDLISVWAIRDTGRIFAPLNEVLLKILEKYFQLVVTCFRLTMEFRAFCFSRSFSNQKDYVLFFSREFFLEIIFLWVLQNNNFTKCISNFWMSFW